MRTWEDIKLLAPDEPLIRLLIEKVDDGSLSKESALVYIAFEFYERSNRYWNGIRALKEKAPTE